MAICKANKKIFPYFVEYYMMKKIILLLGILLMTSCSKYGSLKIENEALKTDTMLQNKTIKRLFNEKDSLENKLLLDSLKNIKL